jgi:hypothetical protein
MVIDLNRRNVATAPVSTAINDRIEQCLPVETNTRQYLGASSVGGDCLRQVQYDWMCDPHNRTRTRDIFERGHFLEGLSRRHLLRAGIVFEEREELLKFEAAQGEFKGHCDGVMIGGPPLPGVGYPCVWEHKGLRHSGWMKIDREGFDKAYPKYCVQVWIYMAYLGLTANPAVITVTDADTMERLHLLLPFDIERAQLWSDRAVAIIKATRANELLPRFTDNPNDYRCKSICSHKDRCWGARAA